jgi:hypothetical protein
MFTMLSMLSSLTTTSVSFPSVFGLLAAVGIVVFFGMTVQKEFAGARSGPQRMKLLGQVVIIGIIPLLIALLLLMIKNISQLMR